MARSILLIGYVLGLIVMIHIKKKIQIVTIEIYRKSAAADNVETTHKFCDSAIDAHLWNKIQTYTYPHTFIPFYFQIKI